MNLKLRNLPTYALPDRGKPDPNRHQEVVIILNEDGPLPTELASAMIIANAINSFTATFEAAMEPICRGFELAAERDE